MYDPSRPLRASAPVMVKGRYPGGNTLRGPSREYDHHDIHDINAFTAYTAFNSIALLVCAIPESWREYPPHHRLMANAEDTTRNPPARRAGIPVAGRSCRDRAVRHS